VDYIHHYDSPLGGITLAADGDAVIGLWFDGQRYFADTLEGRREARRLPIFDAADAWLDVYFSGRDPGPAPKLALRTTPFRRAVWTLLMAIPYGKTATYGELAARIARERGLPAMSAQAVGGAVGHNAISLMIPCHRVVGADGSLTGYAAGLAVKRRLLALEGIDTAGFSGA